MCVRLLEISVTFLCLWTCLSYGLEITITPNHTTRISHQDVTISCTPNGITNILFMKISRPGHTTPLATVSQNNPVVYRHDDDSDSKNDNSGTFFMKADGLIVNDEKTSDSAGNPVRSFLSLILFTPAIEESGSYECHVTYLDDDGLMISVTSSATLSVTEADVSTLSKLVEDLSKRVKHLEEVVRDKDLEIQIFEDEWTKQGEKYTKELLLHIRRQRIVNQNLSEQLEDQGKILDELRVRCNNTSSDDVHEKIERITKDVLTLNKNIEVKISKQVDDHIQKQNKINQNMFLILNNNLENKIMQNVTAVIDAGIDESKDEISKEMKKLIESSQEKLRVDLMNSHNISYADLITRMKELDSKTKQILIQKMEKLDQKNKDDVLKAVKDLDNEVRQSINQFVEDLNNKTKHELEAKMKDSIGKEKQEIMTLVGEAQEKLNEDLTMAIKTSDTNSRKHITQQIAKINKQTINKFSKMIKSQDVDIRKELQKQIAATKKETNEIVSTSVKSVQSTIETKLSGEIKQFGDNLKLNIMAEVNGMMDTFHRNINDKQNKKDTETKKWRKTIQSSLNDLKNTVRQLETRGKVRDNKLVQVEKQHKSDYQSLNKAQNEMTSNLRNLDTAKTNIFASQKSLDQRVNGVDKDYKAKYENLKSLYKDMAADIKKLEKRKNDRDDDDNNNDGHHSKHGSRRDRKGWSWLNKYKSREHDK